MLTYRFKNNFVFFSDTKTVLEENIGHVLVYSKKKMKRYVSKQTILLILLVCMQRIKNNLFAYKKYPIQGSIADNSKMSFLINFHI